jgi:hypothetical protein
MEILVQIDYLNKEKWNLEVVGKISIVLKPPTRYLV